MDVKHHVYLLTYVTSTVQLNSVQFKMVSMRSEKPICALPRLSEVFLQRCVWNGSSVRLIVIGDLTPTKTVRLISDGKKTVGGKGVWRWGEEADYIPIATLSPPQWMTPALSWPMGGDENHVNVSLTARDKVTRQCPQSTTFEEKGEPKRIRTEALLLMNLTR